MRTSAAVACTVDSVEVTLCDDQMIESRVAIHVPAEIVEAGDHAVSMFLDWARSIGPAVERIELATI